MPKGISYRGSTSTGSTGRKMSNSGAGGEMKASSKSMNRGGDGNMGAPGGRLQQPGSPRESGHSGDGVRTEGGTFMDKKKRMGGVTLGI